MVDQKGTTGLRVEYSPVFHMMFKSSNVCHCKVMNTVFNIPQFLDKNWGLTVENTSSISIKYLYPCLFHFFKDKRNEPESLSLKLTKQKSSGGRSD